MLVIAREARCETQIMINAKNRTSSTQLKNKKESKSEKIVNGTYIMRTGLSTLEDGDAELPVAMRGMTGCCAVGTCPPGEQRKVGLCAVGSEGEHAS